MKKILPIALVALFAGSCHRTALASDKTGTLMEKTAQGVAFTETFDMSGLDRFSVQAVYSDGTPSGKSFSDGAKATVNITVSSAAYVFNSTPTLKINGTTVSYTPVATATGTAKAISTAIMANSSLNTLIVSTHTSSVVYATAAAVGAVAYSVSSSSGAALTPSSSYMIGGLATDVDLGANTITESAHGFPTGLRALFATTSGTAPTGLTTGTTYWTIRATDNTYQLATSSTLALAGTAIDITAQTGSGVFAVTPLTISAGSAGFKWQASNDGSNFTDLSVASVTYSAAGNSIWDFGSYNYRWLRIVFVAPTSGGIALSAKMHAKRD